MQSHDGRPGVHTLLFALSRLRAECERRAAIGGPPLLATLAGETRDCERALAKADERKQWALAEARRADRELDRLYAASRARLDRARCGIILLYGRAASDLLSFGIPARAQRRAEPLVGQTKSTPSTGVVPVGETLAERPAGRQALPATSAAPTDAAMEVEHE